MEICAPCKIDNREIADLPDKVNRANIPDCLWPSNNDAGVPLLDLRLQADAVDIPVQVWGEIKRGTLCKKGGTVCFYTEDYRFEKLWKDPSPLVNSKVVNIVEPNFSVYQQVPPAVALYNTYRKRWLARYWQSKGLRVFVDLNVAPYFYEVNLLGVPDGWRAYATRGYSERLDHLMLEHALACKKAGHDDLLFLVYGGGLAVKKACQSHGWIWCPETMDIAKGKELPLCQKDQVVELVEAVGEVV